jgi:predicted transcriptional regulator
MDFGHCSIAVKASRKKSALHEFAPRLKFAKPNLQRQTTEGEMARPATKDLTDRELEVMHVFWRQGEITAAEARDELATAGLDRAYVTVANLTRILLEKGFLEAVNDQRPFRYRPVRSFDDAARGMVGDLLQRVFQGSREQLLVNVFERRKRLTAKERALLEQVLKEQA